jgi:CrcB protein
MIGGALGTAARWGLNGVISAQQNRFLGWPAVFPFGTLVVNVSGCFLIGLIVAFSEPSLGRVWIKPEYRDFLIVGICGGFTTFSSYGIQTLSLARDQEWLLVLLNVTASNVIGILAVYVGLVFG